MNTTFGWFLVAAILIDLVLLGWVYNDANERQANGLLWVLAILAGNIPVLLIYLATRPEVKAEHDVQNLP